MLQVADSVLSRDSVDGAHMVEAAEQSLPMVNGPVTTRETSKVSPVQVLNVNFLPTLMAHVTALMIGAVPTTLVPVLVR